MATIQLKRLTSTDIDQATAVLKVGEPCLAEDTEGKKYIVFGDGTTPLKDLKREPIGDAGSVAIDNLTIVENSDDELEVQISEEDDNALEVKTDGLFVETLDQVKVSAKDDLPTTGKENTIYIVSDEEHIYYWDGSKYVLLTEDITGLIYKGAKDTTADLPTTGMDNGDFYWIVDEDKFKIWNGTTWDTIELAQDQADMAETVTTSLSFIKNKKSEYIAYTRLATGSSLPDTVKTVKDAIDELDKLAAKKQDKVTTAKENNYASWNNAGQTKDSGDSKTTVLSAYDTASDNKLPSEKAVAKKFQDIEDQLNSQATGNAGDQGDKAILPLMTTATACYYAQPGSADGQTFTDDIVGGYVFSSAQGQYLNKMFNRFKLFVLTPGWVRIGIVRGTGTDEYDGTLRGFCKAGRTYNTTDVYPTSLVNGEPDTTCDGQSHTMLKKWLVVQWVATPGLHEFDIPDEVITSPVEFLYIECRQGVSGFAMNKGTTAVDSNGLSVPASIAPTAATWPTSYLTATNFNNGTYAVSNNMLDTSARYTYSANEGSNGVIYCSWNDVLTKNPAQNVVRTQNFAWLNLGVYQRGNNGNTYLDPVVENCITKSTIYNNVNSCLSGYGPSYDQQQILAAKGSRIYGIELIITNPGDLTFYVFSSIDPTKAKIVKAFTLRIRSVGKQLIHLPEEVILQPGQWCGVSGITEATIKGMPNATAFGSTVVNKGYYDDARFAYQLPTVSNWNQFGDDPTGVKNLRPFNSATGTYSTSTFQYWRNVKYIPETGKVDFTNAYIDYVAAANNGYLNVSLVIRGGNRSKLEDMNFSVTGDSISTYAGQISKTDDYGVTHNAAGDNAIFYPNSGSGLTVGIDTTWWGILGKQCRMRLVKNDAWSGSQVGGTDSNTSSTACASQIRTSMLSCSTSTAGANTTTGLGTPYGLPDAIFCMIGTNDLAGNRTTGAWTNTAPANIDTIIGAFEKMVALHKAKFPAARLVYFLIPRGNQTPYPYTNANGLSLAQLAEEFEKVATKLGAFFVPLNYFASLNRGNYTLWTATAGCYHPRISVNTGIAVDYLHPSALGHQQIADGLQRFCEEVF